MSYPHPHEDNMVDGLPISTVVNNSELGLELFGINPYLTQFLPLQVHAGLQQAAPVSRNTRQFFGGARLVNPAAASAASGPSSVATMGNHREYGPRHQIQGPSTVTVTLSEENDTPLHSSTGPCHWPNQQTDASGVASNLPPEARQALIPHLTSGQYQLSRTLLQEPPYPQEIPGHPAGVMASENVISPGGLAPSKHYHRQNTAVTISTLPAETVSGSGKLRCPLCPNLSARSQERKRHVHLHLPCCVFCPEQDCLWRGDRKDTLQGHLGRKHGISGKFDKAHYIYDAKELVTKLIDGDITLSEATKRAKTGVYAKAEAVETAKAVEWKRDFRGPKRKVLE